jgi:hypothetical protein
MPKHNRDVMVAFRLTATEAEVLRQDMETSDRPGLGESINKYARELVVQHLGRKLRARALAPS